MFWMLASNLKNDSRPCQQAPKTIEPKEIIQSESHLPKPLRSQTLIFSGTFQPRNVHQQAMQHEDGWTIILLSQDLIANLAEDFLVSRRARQNKLNKETESDSPWFQSDLLTF
jgi:hypothetical protein